MPNSSHFKLIYFLAMLYICLIISSSLLGGKVITTSYGLISGASLICPFWFLLNDIVAEVYGFRITAYFFVSAIISEFIFASICILVAQLPSPSSWQHENIYSLFSPLFQIYLLQLLGISLAWYVNTFIITRWKILVKGKYFWLRSIGSSCVGVIIFCVVSVAPSLIIVGSYNTLQDVVSMLMWSFILKLFVLLILAYPASKLVSVIKYIEKSDAYDSAVGFNPFRKAS